MTTPTWTVHHGDCLDVMRAMPAASVDAVVTDPPYGLGGSVVRSSKHGVFTNEGTPAWDVANHSWVVPAAGLLRDGGSLVAFCDQKDTGVLWSECEAAGLKPRTFLLYIKNATPPNPRRCFQSAWEVALWATKGPKYDWNGGALTPNVYFGELEKHNRLHPTQKELGVMKWVARAVLRCGSTVLDPFLGSGTTGVAALEEGCRFIGIEREAEYVAIARARIEAAARAPMLDFGGV